MSNKKKEAEKARKQRIRERKQKEKEGKDEEKGGGGEEEEKKSESKEAIDNLSLSKEEKEGIRQEINKLNLTKKLNDNFKQFGENAPYTSITSSVLLLSARIPSLKMLKLILEKGKGILNIQLNDTNVMRTNVFNMVASRTNEDYQSYTRCVLL